MKSDVALDYAVFQLTPSRNRCELVVVCGEETERLASGLLKPFLVHLKSAEDQYATGTKAIKLKPPPGYGYGVKPEASAWFTKGTIERFVRFVSTPEVLERVGTVEAELVQLEGAIRDHANESTRVDALQSNTAPVATSAASNILLSSTTDQAPTPTPSRRNSLDGAENPTPDENARRRLLRAMEARKMLLHKEQGMAFARATAAGFDMQKMEHLLVFSDCFGANRLGDACVMYTGIFKKSKESGLWDENEWPLSDTTSLRNVPTSPELRPRESDLWSDMHSEVGDFRLDDLRDDVSVRSYSNYYSEDLSLRGYSGADMLRKRSPLEQPPTISPSKARDFGSEYIRVRGGSTQASIDEGPGVAPGQETAAGRAFGDDNSFYSNGTGRWPPAHSSQHSGIRYAADNASESGNDLDAGSRGVRGQRQRRAWGPPPQFLAHQIPLGSHSKSGPLLSGSDGYHMLVRGNQHGHSHNHSGDGSTQRHGESLPSWVTAAGQSDQPWRPGPAEPLGQALPRVAVPRPQTYSVAGNGHAQIPFSTEQISKPPDANGNVLRSPATAWQEHKRRQVHEVQEKTGSSIPAPAVTNAGVSDTSSKDQASRSAAGRTGERPQSRPVVRRASSPRRRSSSPMRRVQVGRNSMRRSGVVVKKSYNYASSQSAGKLQITPKESEASEGETDYVQNGSLLKQAHAAVEGQPGLGWRDGLRVDTDIDSFANLASVPDQSPSRASSGWNTPVEYEIDFPDNASNRTLAGQSARVELLSPKEPKGRFYEQYREKRDAKLREELGSKKAERDAKLKSMQEVLERRNAEMVARKGRGTEKQMSDGEAQVHAEKLRVIKADLVKSKKHTDDEEAKRLEEIANQRRERIAARSSPSPQSVETASTLSTASTPRASTKQPPTATPLPTLIPTSSVTPKAKPSIVRRLSPPKIVTGGAFRGTVSSPAAPMSAPKLVRTSQRRPQTAAQSNNPVENPMSRSVPSLAELRKENTKPALPRNSTYNERPRSTGSKLPGMRGASAPLEPNGGKAAPRAAPTDDKKRRMSIRKSIAVVTDSIKEAPVLAPLKVSKASSVAEQTATTKPNKRLSLSGTRTDSKPFLRKGRGIGPGAGPIVHKSKVAAAPEPIKTPEEDGEKVPDSESQPFEAEAEADREDAKGMNVSVEGNERASVRPDSTTTQASQASGATGAFPTRSSTPPQTTSLDLEEDCELIRPEEWLDSEAVQDARSPARDSETDQYGTPRADLSPGKMHSTTLRHFLNEAPENGSLVYTSGPGTFPHSRSSPLHSIPLSSLTPKGSEIPDFYRAPRVHVSASLGDSMTSPRVPYEVPFAMSEAFPIHEAPLALAAGSPYASPAPPQLQQSLSPEAQASSRLRKKWGSSQKVAAPPTVKESPRGLKRLLKFGRKKDKSSTASTTSDSPSDIDDDMDGTSEHGGRTDELTHIGAKSIGSRMPGKTSGLMGPPAIPEDSVTEGDVGPRLVSIPFVRTSIPTAPANFKTRDDHNGGSSLLKAPRSFFSLSSFRSKVKQ